GRLTRSVYPKPAAVLTRSTGLCPPPARTTGATGEPVPIARGTRRALRASFVQDQECQGGQEGHTHLLAPLRISAVVGRANSVVLYSLSSPECSSIRFTPAAGRGPNPLPGFD